MWPKAISYKSQYKSMMKQAKGTFPKNAFKDELYFDTVKGILGFAKYRESFGVVCEIRKNTKRF